MATKETVPRRGETKRFRVSCDNCSYERSAEGRAEATRLGTTHRRETGHEIVALEVPPSVERP